MHKLVRVAEMHKLQVVSCDRAYLRERLLTGNPLDREDAVPIVFSFASLGLLTGTLTQKVRRVSAGAGWGLPQGRGPRAVGTSPRAAGCRHVG